MENCKTIADKAYEQSKCADLGTPIYGQIVWLKNCVEKRASEGKPISEDYLANCSTMKKITLGIVRSEESKGVKLNKFERQAIGDEIARIILSSM